MWTKATFVISVLACLPANAESFYVMTEADGTVHVATQRLSPEYKRLQFGEHVELRASLQERTATRIRLTKLIASLADEYAVARELVDAVVLVESSYDVEAVSDKGASGLMQLMPDTARRFGVKNVFDAEDNLRGGIKYLRWLLDKFKSVELALAAYNAGEGAVIKAGGVPPYAETRSYVKTILAILDGGI